MQKYIATLVSTYVSDKVDSKAVVNKLYLDFTGNIVLEDVYIEDQNKDTLVSAKVLKGRVSFIKLLHRSFEVNYLNANDAIVYLRRNINETKFNYQFLIDAFKSDTSDNKKFDFKLEEADVTNLRMSFDDYNSGIVFSYSLQSGELAFDELPVISKNLIASDSKINGLVFHLDLLRKNEKLGAANYDSDTSALNIQIKNVEIMNSSFSYSNHNFPLINEGFDYNHFMLTQINGDLNRFAMENNDIKVLLKALSLKTTDGFVVKDLNGMLELPGDSMNIRINKLLTEKTEFDGDMFIKFPSLDMLSDSTSSIYTTTQFKNDKIALDDIHYFYPDIYSILDKRKKDVFITGELKGSLKQFTLNNALLGFDSSNYYKGKITITNLPDLNKAGLIADIKQLRLDVPWFLSFTKVRKIDNVNLNAIGKSRIEGKLTGRFSDLHFDGTTQTAIGKAKGKVVIKTDDQFKLQSVTGRVNSNDLSISKLINGLESFGKITAGTDFNYTDDNLVYIKSDIHKLEFKNKVLSNLLVEGSLIDKKGRFKLTSDNTLIEADLSLSLDLNLNNYLLTGICYELDLSLFNTGLDNTSAGGTIDAMISGSKLDDLNADIWINKFYIRNALSKFRADTVSLKCFINNGYRQISLKSDSISARIEGRFQLSEMPQLFNVENINPRKDGYQFVSERLEFNFSSERISSLISLFKRGINASKIEVGGSYDFKNKSGELEGVIGRLDFNKYSVDNLSVKADGNVNDLRFDISEDRIGLSNGIFLSSPSIRGELKDKTVSFGLNIYENTSNSALGMRGEFSFSSDTLSLITQSLDLKLHGQDWRSEGNATLLYFGKSLAIQNLMLSQGKQKIKIHSQDLLDKGELIAQLWNIQLEPILFFTSIKKYSVKGRLNGGLQVKNLLGNPLFTADLSIDSLSVGKTKAGTLALGMEPLSNERHSINLSLSGTDNNAYVHGYLDHITQIENASGQINVDIPKLSLHFFEPFLKSYLFALHGYLSGKIELSGKVKRPDVKGKIAFEDRNVIGLHFTESKYVIANQFITFNSNKIVFDNLDFRDFEGNKAKVDGYISHDYFKNFDIYLTVDAQNFQVMNTEKVNQAGFYGVLFADIDMTLKGPANDLAIDLKLGTKPKSTINIPLETSNAEFKTPSYIIFEGGESDKDSTGERYHGAPINLSRFKFNGVLSITRDAQINIIVDPSNGDRITARGSGKFDVKVDQDNVPELYGSYLIREGNYTFTFASLVKKDFVIEKGSRLSWNGDIMEGLLNVKASYTTKASRYELISNYTSALSDEFVRSAKRNQPVTVKLNVTGELSEPELSFKIEMPESNDPFLGNMIAQKINEINNDQEQLQRQVFGLIIMNRFFPEGTGTVNAGGNIAMQQANQSVSQILNSELGKIAPESIAGFEIDVNIEALTPDNPGLAQSLQFKASRQISERITITAGGNVNVGNVPNSGQFLGDYSVMYRLNSSGSVNLKFFSTTYQDYYYYYYDNVTTRSGVSIQHKKAFDEFKELFKR